MLHYIIQVLAFQALFLLVYDLFLKRETFFNYNRIYLLLTPIVAIVLPFIKINAITKMVSNGYTIRLPEVLIGQPTPSDLEIEVARQAGIVIEKAQTPLWQTIFVIGGCLAIGYFIFKLIRLYVLKYKSPKRWKGNVLIVNIINSHTAFSFLNTIFLGEQITPEEKPMIIEHEMVHIKERHTVDLLLFEVLRILFWFNPLIYIYQNRVKALHEFIADSKTMEQLGKHDYYQTMLNQVFETSTVSFTNTFFNTSLIKKRIQMLQKQKSSRSMLLKFGILIPAIFGMLLYVSCNKEVDIEDETVNLEQFSYALRLGEEMSPETRKVHDIFQDFLKANPDHVAWAYIDYANEEISYSVHKASEERPEGYKEMTVSFKDGSSYKTYMNIGLFDTPSKDVIEEEQLNPEDFNNASEVPMSVIDQVPTLEACEALTSEEERRKCTSQHIAKFVNQNFNTDIGKNVGLVGKRNRISVKFTINKNGDIVDVIARAPHEDLEEEAERVINLLPKFSPGEHNGKKVNVPYSLPIVFQINE